MYLIIQTVQVISQTRTRFEAYLVFYSKLLLECVLNSFSLLSILGLVNPILRTACYHVNMSSN